MNRRRFLRFAGWLSALALLPFLAFSGIVNQSGARCFGCTADSGGGGDPAPDFVEDFEGFSAGAGISGGDLNLSQLNPGSIRASTDVGHNGSGKSAKFAFVPVGAANPSGETLQLNFDFGATYSEVTCQYYLRIDSNYRHINSFSSDNDKFFRIHARSGGDGGSGVAGYGTQGKLGASTELAARGDTHYSDLASEWDDGLGGLFTAHGSGANDFLGPDDYGVWTKIKWHVKGATGSGGTGRAYLDVWKNDVQIIAERPDDWDGTGASNVYGRGYLFGSRSTGDGTTSAQDGTGAASYDIYMDDIACWVVQ